MTDRKLLSGSLRRVSLADVFQIIGGNSFTGILNLRSQYSAFMGIIYFLNGNPINGYYGDLKGLEAVYSMFGMEDGTYEFYEQELTQIEPVIKHSRMQIVLDALRMLDDGEIIKIGPIAPGPIEVKKKEVERKILQPVKGSSEHNCASCKTLLRANDTKVTILGRDYCFQCAMIRANSMDGTTVDEVVEETSEKVEPIKVDLPKVEIIKADSPKVDPIKVDPPYVNTAVAYSRMDLIKRKLKSMGPFKYGVLISTVLVWIVLGIILLERNNQPVQTPAPITQEKSQTNAVHLAVNQSSAINNAVGSLSTQNTQGSFSGQNKTPQTTDNKSPAIVNTPPSLNTQNAMVGSTKTGQTQEVKSTSPAIGATTSNDQGSTPVQLAQQITEKKPASLPNENIEKPLKESVAQTENTVDSNVASKPETKENEVAQAPAAKTDVKDIADYKKTTPDTNKPAEIAEAVKPAHAEEVVTKGSTVKTVTEIKEPEFPGGKGALAKWLNTNINYPSSAAKMGTTGNVVVELTIDQPDGKISNATIIRSLQKQCDQEVLRLVSKMPNWKPGEVNGVKTTSKYMLSVRFSPE